MKPAEIGSGQAQARAALAGNPSDGYGGAVLAVTLVRHRARVVAQPAATLQVRPESALVRATVSRFARDHAPAAVRTSVQWTTSIPRSVGLGGSSAIVIATLRALANVYRVSLADATLAELALSVEVEELGIAAGLQDRVAQSYGGLTFMDFASPPSRAVPASPAVPALTGGHGYERLDPALLPPLVVAWRTDAAGESGAVHAPLRARHAQGEPVVIESLAELGELARSARAALLAGDRPELARCVDQSFDARRRMLALDPRHVEMIECARAGGAAANYAGSGGAIVAVCANLDQRARVARALRGLRCEATTLHAPQARTHE